MCNSKTICSVKTDCSVAVPSLPDNWRIHHRLYRFFVKQSSRTGRTSHTGHGGGLTDPRGADVKP